MPRRKRRTVSNTSPAVSATTVSSSTKGKTSAEANGQPNIPPTPNQQMPSAVRGPPRQSMKAAKPSMVAYMAKLEGRYATEAWNMPVLVAIMMAKT